MAEDRAWRELRLRLGGDAQQPLEIEVLGADVQAAVRVLPLVARPVGVDLDAVALGVVEIEGLADEVVGRAGQRQPLLEGTLQEATELLLAGQEDGEVIQAGGVRRSLPAVGQRGQAQDRRAARPENGALLVTADPGQAEALVKGDLALEVEDFELRRSEWPSGPVLQYQYVGPSEREAPDGSTATPFGPARARTMVSTLAM